MKVHLFSLLTLCLVSGASLTAVEVADRPNIILIMSDDIGWTDIGCYGSEIRTPNLDRLAENGLRYTQFYNSARCCPTRASLLTGLHPHQTGIGHMTGDRGNYGYSGDLNQNCVTIAEVLKTIGYSTYMSGKWHVTPHPRDLNYSDHNWPLQRGFDRFWGTILGAGSFYDPSTLAEGNNLIVPESEDFYYTREISKKAVQYVDEHDGETPFFLYVAYTAPHWPMQAPEQDIEPYYGMYDEGWEVLRERRIEGLKRLGIWKDEWPIPPPDHKAGDWDSTEYQDLHARTMEVYAAMVTIMDEGIGQIVDAVKRKGDLENTLIFYLQDNGACAEQLRLSWREGKQYTTPPAREPLGPNEYTLDLFPTHHRDGQPIRYTFPAKVGDPYSYLGYLPGWANAGNAPFRMYKHWVHEGGITSPLIVHWPAGIEMRGEFREQPTQLMDIMATCVEVTGAEYPTEYKGHTIHPLAGLSLKPTFEDAELERSALYWEHEGNRAIRVGDWKLVSNALVGDAPQVHDNDEILPLEHWELFNLGEDRAESNNLAMEYPERVTLMSNLWLEWARTHHVLPKPPRKIYNR